MLRFEQLAAQDRQRYEKEKQVTFLEENCWYKDDDES